MSIELDNCEHSAFLQINDSTFELKKKNTLGSSKEADIYLKGEGVADKHCILRVSSSVVSLMDLGSEHGTFVEQKKIEAGRRVLITEDDELQIGHCYGKIILKKKEFSYEKKSESSPGIVFDNNDDDLELELNDREQNIVSETQEQSSQQLSADVDDIEEEESNSVEAGYELSFNPDAGSKLGAMISKISKPLKKGEEEEINHEDSDLINFDEQTSEDEDSIVNEEVMNEKTVILKRTDEVPISEKLEKFQEEKKESKKTAKTLLKEARKSEETKKPKIKLTPITKFAGVNLRFFAMLIDFFTVTVASALLTGSRIYTEFNALIEKIPLKDLLKQEQLLTKVNEFLPEGLKEVSLIDLIEQNIILVLLYFSFRLITTIVFGVSFGQLLFGLRGTGSSIGKRVGGAIRTLIEPFTAPFLVFDLPCLFKKRTLKEKLTKTGIVHHSKILTIFTALFICPVIVIYLFRGQLVGHIPSLKEVQVDTIDSTLYSEELDNKLPLTSSFFRLKTQVRNYEDYIITPGFKIDRVGSKNIIAPMIYVYHREKGWEAEISVAKDFRMKVLVNDLGETVNWLDEKEKNVILVDKDFQQGSSQINKEKRFQIQKFFLRTFRLHWKNVLDEFFVAKTGIVPYYLAKKHYWDLLNLNDKVYLQRLGFKNLDMFLLSLSKEDSPLLMKDGFLIPMTGANYRIYQVRWSKKKTTQGLIVNFLYDFLYEADFNFHDKAASESNVDYFSALDSFAKSSAPLEKRKKSAEIILAHYNEVTDFLEKSTKNRKAKRKIDEQLNRLKRAIEMTAKNDKEFQEDIMTQIDFLREKLSKVKIEKEDPNADF